MANNSFMNNKISSQAIKKILETSARRPYSARKDQEIIKALLEKERSKTSQDAEITAGQSNSTRRKLTLVDSDGFTSPRKTKKARKPDIDDEAIPNHMNQYEPLDINTQDMETDTTTDTAVENTNNNEKKKTNAPTTRKEIRPPPIEVMGYNNIKELAKACSDSGILKDEITFRKVNDDLTITTKNTKTHSKCKEVLQKKQIPFFSYTPRELRPKNLVLKGVNDGNFSEAEILEEYPKLVRQTHQPQNQNNNYLSGNEQEHYNNDKAPYWVKQIYDKIEELCTITINKMMSKITAKLNELEDKLENQPLQYE
ncbi:hypothetical protein HCN44_007806 [Aphidius gifuensis]|uniref:Uncharacterized protein n=1 Tax=Aphidius gifuensis TaxID=684658 RepID=A0A835CL08_APHGI|nr:hypothetical protein HCN44_007806 [Aphidius gifuensis]